jgi:hypothetical protein
MPASSIYQKICPACASLLPREARRCDCGYSFEAQSASVAPSAEEQALRESELLEAYLQARVEQAVAVLEGAQAGLSKDPKNFDKAAAVLQALRDIRQLRAELNAQTARTVEARNAITTARGDLSDTPIHEPPASTQPTDAFRAEQTARAANVVQNFDGTQAKECPACKTWLPATSALCFCGHSFIQRAKGTRAETSRRPRK